MFSVGPQVFDWIWAMNLARKYRAEGHGKVSEEGFHTTLKNKLVSLPIVSEAAFQEVSHEPCVLPLQI